MEVLYRSNTKGNILKEYCKSLLRNPAAKPRISLHKIIQVEVLRLKMNGTLSTSLSNIVRAVTPPNSNIGVFYIHPNIDTQLLAMRVLPKVALYLAFLSVCLCRCSVWSP